MRGSIPVHDLGADYHRAEARLIAESKQRKYTLAKLSKAVTLAVPIMALLHFDNFLCCYEAAAVGATLLRSYRFDAKVVPAAAVVVKTGEPAHTVMCGGSFEELPAWLAKSHQIAVSENSFIPVDGEHARHVGDHAVIRAGARILDLTIGQLNSKIPDLVPTFGINVESGLDQQAMQWSEELTVSWHTPARAGETMVHIRKVMRHYEAQAQGGKHVRGFLADSRVAVALLLNVGCNVDLWLEKMPQGMSTEVVTRARAAGFTGQGLV